MEGLPAKGGEGDPVYFLHIPHSAGTTLNELLEGQFHRKEVFAGGLLPSLLDMPMEQLARFRLFRGHFGLVLPVLLGWRVRCLTMLRHPMEQALSLFAFMRRSPSHYFHDRVNAPGYGVSDFLRDPACEPLIQNHVARFLAFRPTSEDWDWQPPVDPADPRVRQATFELCPLRLSDDALFDRASATLARAEVVGITEQLDDTLVVLAHAMGWPALGRPGHLNAAPGRLHAQDLNPDDQARLRSLKVLDLELYDLAQRRLAADRCRLLAADADKR